MTHEREHSHAHATTATIRDDGLAPGRSNRASQLIAPANPLISGLIQRKARDANGVAEDADEAVASASSSSGHSLPATLMRRFESSLSADLSSVRVHTGSASAHAAELVGAQAYTIGQDIHFAAGQYDPSSRAGQHLLAHEVAHTQQQAGGTPHRQCKLEVSSPSDAAEIEADRAADAMVSDVPAERRIVSGHPVSVSSLGGLSRRVIQREQNQSPAPAKPKEPDGGKCEVADEKEQQAARQAVLDAQAAAIKAVMDTALWTTGQFTKYISDTVESPKVVDKNLLLGAAVKGVVAAGIRKVAEAFSTPGMIVKGAITLLAAAIGGKVGTMAQDGKPLTPSEASSAGREAAKQALLAKLVFIKDSADEAVVDVKPKYQAALDSLGARFNEKADVQAVADWANADIAASKASVPADDRLYHNMLATWLGNHSLTAQSGAENTNHDDWKKACKTLFGRDDIPPECFWALQVRTEWANMGLPTSGADKWINARSPVSSANAHFTNASDGQLLAKAAGIDPSTPEGKVVAAGGLFSLDCAISTMSNQFSAGVMYYECSQTEYLLVVDTPPMAQAVQKNFTGKFIRQAAAPVAVRP